MTAIEFTYAKTEAEVKSYTGYVEQTLADAVLVRLVGDGKPEYRTLKLAKIVRQLVLN